MTTPNITVTYVGRYATDWVPHGSAAAHPSPEPPTSPIYVDFLSRNLEEEKTKQFLPPTKQAERLMLTRWVLDRARDPQGRNLSPGLEEMSDKEIYYRTFLRGQLYALQVCIEAWSTGKKTADDNAGDDKVARRDAADRKAQRDVPALYNDRCVLTGTFKPEGAHIVPVRAKYADYGTTWDMLCTFWPLSTPADVTVQGQEHCNIIPLIQTAHALFDAYYFALRPIAHPQTPSTAIFLQVVYLRDPDEKRISAHWDHRRFGGLCDFRRTPNPNSPAQHPHQNDPDHDCTALQHGDVYKLVTDDPESHPLPSERLLQVQYGLHQIMSGIRAEGALKDAFSGTPPPDDDGTGLYTSVPDLWQDLIKKAQDLGILDEDAAARWARAFARQAQEDAENDETWAAFLEREHDGNDLFRERDHEDDPNSPDQDRFGKGKGADDQGYDLC